MKWYKAIKGQKKHHGEDDNDGGDIQSQLRKIQDQLQFLEKKIDTLIAQSHEKGRFNSNRQPRDHKRGFGSKERSFGGRQRDFGNRRDFNKGQSERGDSHGGGRRHSGRGNYRSHKPSDRQDRQQDRQPSTFPSGGSAE